MNEEFNINRIISILLPKWPIILICSLVFTIGAFFITKFFIEPVYVSSGTLYVTGDVASVNDTVNKKDTTVSDVVLSRELAITYGHILSSNSFFKGVEEESRLGYNYLQLKAMTSISNVEDTGILNIRVSHKDPEVATDIVNSILKLAPEEIARVVVAGSAVTIDKAEVPVSPDSPSIPKNTLIGFILGFVIACAFIFVVDLLDDTLKRADEVERLFGFPVLGTIPYVGQSSSNLKVSKPVYAKS